MPAKYVLAEYKKCLADPPSAYGLKGCVGLATGSVYKSVEERWAYDEGYTHGVSDQKDGVAFIGAEKNDGRRLGMFLGGRRNSQQSRRNSRSSQQSKRNKINSRSSRQSRRR